MTVIRAHARWKPAPAFHKSQLSKATKRNSSHLVLPAYISSRPLVTHSCRSHKHNQKQILCSVCIHTNARCCSYCTMDIVRSTYQRSCIGGNSGGSRRKEDRKAYINIVKRADIVLQYKGQRHERHELESLLTRAEGIVKFSVISGLRYELFCRNNNWVIRDMGVLNGNPASHQSYRNPNSERPYHSPEESPSRTTYCLLRRVR